MKDNTGLIVSFTLLLLVFALEAAHVPVQPPAILEQGPHHRTWEYSSYGEDNGQQTLQTHSYTELKSGLNVWADAQQQWVEASDEIELFQGAAVARKAGHQVIFSAQAKDQQGTIHLQLPDRRSLRARTVGLAYTDATGKSVFIAELQDSIGELVAPRW